MTFWKLRTPVPLLKISLWAGAFVVAGMAGFGFGRMLEAPAAVHSQATADDPLERRNPRVTQQSWFNSEWRTEAEIKAHIAVLGEEQARALLQEHDGTFWRGHPNASETFRAVLMKLMERDQPMALLTECAGWIEAWQLPEATARRLWREAVGIVCSQGEVEFSEVALLVRSRSPDYISATLEALLDVRPAASIEAALAQAEQFLAAAGLKEDEALKARARAMVTTAWLTRAPEEALKVAAATEAVAIREALHEPLRRMRALDPKRAHRMLRLASEHHVYPEAVGETAFVAGFTPEEMREAFKDAPQKTRLRYLDMYASRADEMSPEDLVTLTAVFSAEELVPEASGNGLSQYGANAVIRALAERDPVECERWLASLEPNVREEVLSNVMNFPALFDAPFARFYLDQERSSSASTAQPYEIRRAIRVVAQDDPALAMTYLDRLPAGHRVLAEKELRTSQIADLLRESPNEAMALAESAPESMRRDIVGFAIAQRYGDDPQGAAEWMNTVQDPELRKFLEIHLIMSRAADVEMSGEERSQRLISLGASPEAIESAVTEQVVSSSWGDPEEGGKVILRQPDASSNWALVELLMSNWAIHNPDGAAAWAATLPPGPSLDVAVNQLIKAMPNQPEDALSWASVISDRKHRFVIVEALVKQWGKADLRTAERLVESAPLARGERDALARMLAETPQARREANGM